MTNQNKEIKKPSLVELKKARETVHKKLASSSYNDEHFQLLKNLDASIKEIHDNKATEIKEIKARINGAELELSDLYSKRELKKLGYVLSAEAAPKTPRKRAAKAV